MKYYKTSSVIWWIVWAGIWVISAILLEVLVDHSSWLSNNWFIIFILLVITFFATFPVSTVALIVQTIRVDHKKFLKWKEGFVRTGQYAGFRRHAMIVIFVALALLVVFTAAFAIYCSGNSFSFAFFASLVMSIVLTIVILVGNIVILIKIGQRSVYGVSAEPQKTVGQAAPGFGDAYGHTPYNPYGSAQSDSPKVASFDTYRTAKGSYIVKGDNFDRYLSEWGERDKDDYTPVVGEPERELIPASAIEGISLGASEVANQRQFWSQHDGSGTIETFKAIASHIPEVRANIVAGRPLSDLVKDPRLGKCANLYFNPSQIPNVIKCNGYYVFESNGRHRILAARRLGYDIPVRVVGIK